MTGIYFFQVERKTPLYHISIESNVFKISSQKINRFLFLKYARKELSPFLKAAQTILKLYKLSVTNTHFYTNPFQSF